MRKIKFRAWDKEQNKYFYFDLLNIDSIFTMHQLNNWNEILTIEQFTGIKDKEGVEIYEGDIIEFGAKLCVVEFCECHYELISTDEKFINTLYNSEWDELEVIGNIHENPELLEEGK